MPCRSLSKSAKFPRFDQEPLVPDISNFENQRRDIDTSLLLICSSSSSSPTWKLADKTANRATESVHSFVTFSQQWHPFLDLFFSPSIKTLKTSCQNYLSYQLHRHPHSLRQHSNNPTPPHYKTIGALHMRLLKLLRLPITSTTTKMKKAVARIQPLLFLE